MPRRAVLSLLGGAALSPATGCLERQSTTGTRADTPQSTPTAALPRTDPSTPTGTAAGTERSAGIPRQLDGIHGSTYPSESVQGTYDREFHQSVDGRETSFDVTIPKALYNYYTARTRVPEFGCYVSDRFDDQIIDLLADRLERYGERNALARATVVDHAIAIIQGMEYTADVATGFDEYPRFPVETLVDRGGDCEDTSILLASILDSLGYGTVLLLLPEAGHVAVGLRGEESIEGAYYEHRGGRYYYVETTGSGWRVGEIPPVIVESGADATIVEIGSEPVLAFDWRIRTATGNRLVAEIGIGNEGNAPARDAGVRVAIEDRTGSVLADVGRPIPDPLMPDAAGRVQLPLPALPGDRSLRVRVMALLHGHVHDEDRSEYRDPTR